MNRRRRRGEGTISRSKCGTYWVASSPRLPSAPSIVVGHANLYRQAETLLDEWIKQHAESSYPHARD